MQMWYLRFMETGAEGGTDLFSVLLYRYLHSNTVPNVSRFSEKKKTQKHTAAGFNQRRICEAAFNRARSLVPIISQLFIQWRKRREAAQCSVLKCSGGVLLGHPDVELTLWGTNGFTVIFDLWCIGCSGSTRPLTSQASFVLVEEPRGQLSSGVFH